MESSLVQRMIGAARLDAETYEAVERDTNATSSALIVVVLAALASGVAALALGDDVVDLLLGIAGSVVGWILYAAVAYFIGTRIFQTAETRATLGELLRTLGFAQAPGVLLVLAIIPILGAFVSLVVAVWILITTIIAVRQALDFTTGRAVGTAVVSWVINVIVNGLVIGILA